VKTNIPAGPYYVTDDGEQPLVRQECSDYVLATIEDGGHVGASVECLSYDDMCAIANLFAAAPDMLAALKGLMAAFSGLAAVREEKAAVMNEAERAARAAIAKAEGAQ